MLGMNIIKNKKQLTLGFILFVFLIPILIAQEAGINVEHTGYGQTSREARFSIYNTGDIQLTNITISVDGKEYKKIRGAFGPGIGLTTSLYLDPGEHLIEARTPEGAYDSLTITISSARGKPTIIPEETPSILEGNLIWVIIGILIIIVVTILWLLLRKPKLEIEEQYPQYS